MSRIFAALILALIAAPTRADDSITEADRFRLWNDCRPIWALVEVMPPDAEKSGLPQEGVETAVRARLQSARIFSDARTNTYLHVNIHLVGRAFSIEVMYRKPLYDEISEAALALPTWERGSVGTSGDADFIRASVARKVEKFIDEYLTVNASACGN